MYTENFKAQEKKSLLIHNIHVGRHTISKIKILPLIPGTGEFTASLCSLLCSGSSAPALGAGGGMATGTIATELV